MLGYDRTGAGPPIVLMHPLGADRRVWDGVVPLLSDRFDVLTVDLPGFGESAPLPGPDYSPAALAVAVSSFLDGVAVERPHVVGNSLGGWVALEMALHDRAASATAIAPAGLWRRPLGPKPPVARTLARIFLPLIGPALASRAGRRLLLSGSAARPELVDRGAALHLIRSYARAPGFTEVNAAMRSGSFDGLERIAVPVTLVWPEHDGLVRRPRHLPDNVTSVTLEGAGHIPMLDAPDEVARVIEQATAAVTASRQSAMPPAGR